VPFCPGVPNLRQGIENEEHATGTLVHLPLSCGSFIGDEVLHLLVTRASLG
jgi:hypothetical protein